MPSVSHRFREALLTTQAAMRARMRARMHARPRVAIRKIIQAGANPIANVRRYAQQRHKRIHRGAHARPTQSICLTQRHQDRSYTRNGKEYSRRRGGPCQAIAKSTRTRCKNCSQLDATGLCLVHQRAKSVVRADDENLPIVYRRR